METFNAKNKQVNATQVSYENIKELFSDLGNYLGSSEAAQLTKKMNYISSILARAGSGDYIVKIGGEIKLVKKKEFERDFEKVV